MKKYIFTLVIFAATQALSASHSFYIGGSLSQTSISGKRSDSVTNITPTSINLANNKSVHAKAAYGGLLVGYLFRIENFGIGPEFFYNYSKFETTIDGKHTDAVLGPTNTVFDITHKFSNQHGVNARLGYFLDSYFLYALFGVHSQTSQFYAKATQDQAGGALHDYAYRTKKKNTSTFSFGFGAQKTIAENYAVGIECKIANFSNKNFSWNLNDGAGVQTKLTSNFKYQLRSVALKLMYVF